MGGVAILARTCLASQSTQVCSAGRVGLWNSLVCVLCSISSLIIQGKMSSAAPFMQVMSASYAIASKAGSIIRDIMKAGDLGVVLKNQVWFSQI